MDLQKRFPVPVEWLGETDESMAESVALWAGQEVIDRRLELSEDFERLLAPAMKKLFVEIGLQSLLLPSPNGGGLDSTEAAITGTLILEQVAAGDTGIGFIYANMLAVQYALAIAPDAGRKALQEYAPLFTGDSPAIASVVLPGYGGDGWHGLAFPATAERSGDSIFITGGPCRPQCSGRTATLFAVACDLGDGVPGLVAVSAGSSGLRTGEELKKTGLSASINCDIFLDKTEVPAGALLLEGEEAFTGFLSWYYSACSAVAIGALAAIFEILLEWENTRVIKGKGQAFRDNLLVMSRTGEIGSAIATSRQLAYSLARMLAAPDIYGHAGGPGLHATAISITRTVCQLCTQAAQNSMELMASAGYATEWNLERYWRDIRTIQSYVFGDTYALTRLAAHYLDPQQT